MISIKGGWLNRIPVWDKWEKSRTAIIGDKTTPKFKYYFVLISDWFLDGSQLGTFLFTFIMAAIQPDLGVALLTGFVWWFWSTSSMGEEAGGVGDYKENWGEYSEIYSRPSAFKKAFYHGIAGGALLAITSGWLGFIPFLGLLPIVYFVGSSLHRLIHKERRLSLIHI